jgi:hypothetical protein
MPGEPKMARWGQDQSVKCGIARVDYYLMTTGDKVRPAYVVVLVAVVVAVMAIISIQGVRRAHDRADLRHAVATAHRLDAPAGAVVSHECHGDGTVACYRSRQDVAAVAASLRSDLAEAAHHKVSLQCDHGSCMLAARWGGRGTFVFIHPLRQRVGGRTVITGSLVSVSAA